MPLYTSAKPIALNNIVYQAISLPSVNATKITITYEKLWQRIKFLPLILKFYCQR